jgi:hypothetical protein
MKLDIVLKEHGMIKPGTMCMIRGVPQYQAGSDCNGKIVQVVAVNVAYTQNCGETVYNFEPTLYSQHKDVVRELHASKQRYLHPLTDFDADELTETTKQLETA